MSNASQLFRADFGSGTMGVVHTPIRAAQELMSNDIQQALRRRKTNDGFLVVLDPCSGTGNLVFALIESLKQLGVSPKKTRIYSNDSDSVALSAQRKQLIKRHPEWASAVEFTNVDFLAKSDSRRYDIVLMNPPWVGYKGLTPSYASKLRALFPFLKGQFDVLDPFVWKAHSLIQPSGSLLAFLPDKVLSSHQPSNCLDVLREKITIERKVALPPKFFSEIQHDSVYLSIQNKAPGKSLLRSLPRGTRLSDILSVFRGIEISGRSSNYLSGDRLTAFDSSRPFVTGRHIGPNGDLKHLGDQYLAKSIPKTLIKKQFSYSGPCILIRKTGSPVAVAFCSTLPFTSQVVFCAVPKPGTEITASLLKQIANYLLSAEGQKQLSNNSGKLSRSVFPYVTISDINDVQIPRSIAQRILMKKLKEAA